MRISRYQADAAAVAAHAAAAAGEDAARPAKGQGQLRRKATGGPSAALKNATSASPSPANNEVEERLKARRQAWRDRLRSAPEAAQVILSGYRNCAEHENRRIWHYYAAEAILALAEPIPEVTWEARAHCPLCGRGSTSPWDKGFKLPEGLLRHLTGERKAHECDIMVIARILADEDWGTDFAARLTVWTPKD